MRTAASIAIAFAALATAADAHAERRDCEVVFVRAPDDVRLVIESWLRAEPRCSGTIELRVVETETDTLYLIAQRPDGRIHEREVPDAQSAGVLVASWVADDWTSAPPEQDETAPDAAVTMSPFGGVAVADTAPSETRPRATSRWLSATGMLAMEGDGGHGGRVEMDLAGGRSSNWTLGVALAGVASQMFTSTQTGFGTLETMDVRALFVAARTWRLGENWNVRWSIGVGPMYTEGRARLHGGALPEVTQGVTAAGMSLAYESTLTVARELLDHRWAITAGPEATIISQTLDGYMDGYDMQRDKIELMFLLGARYRL